MATTVQNCSDLLRRLSPSCVFHPLAQVREAEEGNTGEEVKGQETGKMETPAHRDEGSNALEEVDDKEEKEKRDEALERRIREMEGLMEEVFDSVSAMKRAYVTLQGAHCPWDPERMRAADVAVVAELRRLGTLREGFRRGRGGGRGRGLNPYRGALAEAAMVEMKREMRAMEAEVESLKQKLRNASNGRFHQSQRRLGCVIEAVAPTAELFIACANQLKEASKSLVALLVSLMRSARWDISSTISSTLQALIPPPPAQHAKYVIESFVTRKVFQGFENETFYIEGSLSSLLHPDKFRHDCFAQFCNMKAMDPVELLGILPTCHFGKFCNRKYLSILHSDMEESLFGSLDQRQAVLAGDHPRTEFYIEFLKLAKAVWLLHLLAFSLDPVPNQFEAAHGADFHPEYMESVVKIPGGRMPTKQMEVGFPVSHGFNIGSRSVIKARVYLVSKLNQA